MSPKSGETWFRPCDRGPLPRAGEGAGLVQPVCDRPDDQAQPGVPPHPSAQPLAIEDDALIGDCVSAALVGKNGGVDRLCWPRFDSGACFAALLGTPENGRRLIAPRADGREAGPQSTPGGILCTRRAYRGDTVVLETVFDRPGGCVAPVDFMVPGAPHPTLVRIVEGRRGRVAMRAETELRFDHGRAVPSVTRLEEDERGVVAVAGPAAVVMRAPVPMRGEGQKTVADFEVSDGQRLAFVLGYGPSHDGLVWRHRTDDGGEIASDGLPPGEGAFLMCGFWYAMALHRQGRADETRAVFGRLVGLCNDVGLLSEECDPRAGRFTGTFPQAFSRVGLVIAAMTLTGRVASHAAPPEGSHAAD